MKHEARLIVAVARTTDAVELSEWVRCADAWKLPYLIECDGSLSTMTILHPTTMTEQQMNAIQGVADEPPKETVH